MLFGSVKLWGIDCLAVGNVVVVEVLVVGVGIDMGAKYEEVDEEDDKEEEGAAALL